MTDVAEEDDDGVKTDEFYTPDKPPQIEAWKVPGSEDLPDEVKSDPIPEPEGDDA